MERNKKNNDNLSVVDYKLIKSILGLNAKKFLGNQNVKKTKDNEKYLIKMKNHVELKYVNFTQSITKYVNNKENSIKIKNKDFSEKILCFNNILTQKFNKTFNRYIKRNKQISFLDKVKKVIKIQSVFRSYIF